MALPDTFSRRQRLANKSVADVYQYTDIPQKFRIQLCQIVAETLGEFIDTSYDTTAGVPIYREMAQRMRREIGTFILPPTKSGWKVQEDKEFFDWLLYEDDLNRSLDGIEVAYRGMMMVTRMPNAFRGLDTRDPDEAVLEANARLLESGVGYQFASGQLIRVDSQIAHSQIVIPALQLLSDAKYATAEKEFLAAHAAYRGQDYETCLIECGKAFESTLKIIGTAQGWSITQNDPAKRLLDAAYTAGFIDPVLQNEFTALRSLLETAVPVMRNKMAGHGAGAAPRNVPAHFASLQLHQTAALILFLAQHHAANP